MRPFACQTYRIFDGRSDRHPHRNRMLHFSYDRYQLVHDRNVCFNCTVYVIHRFHVKDRDAAVDRQSAGLYDLFRQLVD